MCVCQTPVRVLKTLLAPSVLAVVGGLFYQVLSLLPVGTAAAILSTIDH